MSILTVGDKQMLRILGRGHSVPTVTELIFVRAQCLTILLQKHFALCGTITGSALSQACTGIEHPLPYRASVWLSEIFYY